LFFPIPLSFLRTGGKKEKWEKAATNFLDFLGEKGGWKKGKEKKWEKKRTAHLSSRV